LAIFFLAFIPNLFDKMDNPKVQALYSFARAAITKYYNLSGLNNRNLFSPSSGGWRSKRKVLVGLVSPEASLLGLQMATYSCPQMVFPLCVHIPGVSLCA